MKLRSEQQKMIHSKPSKYSLIKGLEGSGKTTAVIYRSLYLKNHYCLYEEDKILMLSSGDEGIDYIKDIYSIAEEETKLDYLSLFSNKEENFHVVKLESILFEYFLKYKNKHKLNRELIVDHDKKINIMKSCILEVKSIYPKLRILSNDYTEFFIEEIKWIKSCNYLNEDAYLKANRTGRRCAKGRGPQSVLKNSNTRKAIFALMLIYNERLALENFLDAEDINICALKTAKTSAVDKYSHIIIDKSNNLTKIQLEFVNALLNEKSYSNMVFIVDMNIPHSSNSWMIKGKRINTNPLGAKVKVYSFINNYNEQEKPIETLNEITNKKLDSSSFENFEYCDIRHNRSYEFMRDYSRISDILIDDEKGEHEYVNEELLAIPVYSDIAAGEPIMINSEVEGNFYIPKYWLRGVKDSFILKVKGDSMIGANINHGDYVVIRQDHAANNKDIVAVDIGGNATLKRLSIENHKILLLPENEKYKPIVVDNEDTYILGIAVGIIKHKS